MMLGPCASVDNPVFVSCRCGLSHKSKLSYEKFLSAFEDNRHAGYGRVTLDTPGKVVTPVVFERHDSLTPEAAINRLRSKISENPETIQRVSVFMSRIASCGKKFLPYIDRNFSNKYRKIPKISPGAYIFQRPFLRGLFLEGPIFGGAYLRREICVSKSIRQAL